MSYIDKTLMANEKIIYRTRPHWIIFSPAAGWAILTLAILMIGPFTKPGQWSFGTGHKFYSVLATITLVLAIINALIAYIEYISSEFGITNKRVLIKVGLIRRDSLEIMLRKIESIQVMQSIPGRILDYGMIIIAGTGGSKDRFKFIPSPLNFRKTTQEQIEQRIREIHDRD